MRPFAPPKRPVQTESHPVPDRVPVDGSCERFHEHDWGGAEDGGKVSMTQSRRWTLAGLSGGGTAAAVAAIVAHQLLQTIVPSFSGPAPWWVKLGVGLGMSLAATGALAGVYRGVLRYGAKLAREGRERPLLAFAVGVGPWLAFLLWLILQTAR